MSHPTHRSNPWLQDGEDPASQLDFWVQDAEEEVEDSAAWGASSEANFLWYQDSSAKLASSKLGEWLSPGHGIETAVDPAKAKSYKIKPATANQHFRPEIEGLRSIAVLLIVVYHVWLGRVSGGVDVFLFISAFLLSSSFARRLDAAQPFAPVKYWLRTFTRIMPPAAVTILITLVATYFFLPPSAWQNVISEAFASATYTQNMYLSARAVDYYALDASLASPLQHFWSLSLQGQVFLLWPLLFISVAFLAKRSKHPRALAFLMFSIIFAASLSYSIFLTSTDQSAAYFSAPARAWEVALGTMLALALPRLDKAFGAARPGEVNPPRFRTLRALLGWLGLALLLSVGILVDVKGLFPGWIAIWPLSAAALIILSGYSGSRFGFDRILTMKLPRALSTISYALYLVHWPILIMWLSYSKQPRAGILDGLAVILGSLIIALLLSKVVDSPFKRPSWKEASFWQSATVITASMALVCASAFGWRYYLAQQSNQQAEQAVGEIDAPFDPSLLSPKGYELPEQWPELPYPCAEQSNAPVVFHPDVVCESLKPLDADTSGLMVIVGSSHSRQWIPALEVIAQSEDLQILNLSMHGCLFTAEKVGEERCDPYYDWALEQIEQLQPDYVFTTSTLSRAEPSRAEVLVSGTSTAIQSVLDLGSNVIAVRDNPRWLSDAYHCAEAVIEAGGDPSLVNAACAAKVEEKLAALSPATELSELSSENAVLSLWDFTDQLCAEGVCSPLIGNTYVYIDDNHLSKVFVSQLGPLALEKFDQAFKG